MPSGNRSSKLGAARLVRKVRDGLAAVAEWEAEHGALTKTELKAARRRLASSGRPRRTARRRLVIIDT